MDRATHMKQCQKTAMKRLKTDGPHHAAHAFISDLRREPSTLPDVPLAVMLLASLNANNEADVRVFIKGWGRF